MNLNKKRRFPSHIFRAGAIYGIRRSALARAALQEPQIIHKDGALSSRIHVEDLAQIICASIKSPKPGSIYNAVDDLPTPPEAPLELAFDLLGKPRPETQAFETVEDDLSLALKSIYLENRLVSNEKIKSELGVVLRYPTFKEGYAALDEARKKRVEKARKAAQAKQAKQD